MKSTLCITQFPLSLGNSFEVIFYHGCKSIFDLKNKKMGYLMRVLNMLSNGLKHYFQIMRIKKNVTEVVHYTQVSIIVKM